MDARVENTEEEGKREAGNDDMLQKYINKLSKSELQEALIQVLYDGPEWQFKRFINEYIKWWFWQLLYALHVHVGKMASKFRAL